MTVEGSKLFFRIDVTSAKMRRLRLIPAYLLSLPFFVLAEPSFGDHTAAYRIIVKPDGSKVREALRPLPDGQQRYLIELQQPAVLPAVMSGSSNQSLSVNAVPAPQLMHATYQVLQQQNELSSVLQNQQLVSAVIDSTQLLLNSLVVTADPANLALLRSYPGIKSVTPDREIQLYRRESIPLIRVDQVWKLTDSTNKNLTGQGMRIGVLDSGIDYTHPDLGGCFGTGCKVAGGYDFYDYDADPQDKEGHGTHVAGIIAGKSDSQSGVAPDATLYAYRVCNYYCSTIGVVQALERAADPDQNPLTQDALDVVNLSLGGPGTQNDPMTIAANNAAKAGIIVVTAAGNDGMAYGAVGAPANAELAITVAATTKSDQMASYSSRGPADTDQFIKPDLAAPGDEILSTTPGNQSQYKSGTSMAAPHVAGAAALLKQQQPNRTPAMIKSLLMSQTKDTGATVAEQGSGRLDVLAATKATLTMAPQSLSFGKLDRSQSLWQAERKLTLFNHANSSKKLKLTLPTLPAGVRLNITPAAEAEIAAGATLEVTLQIQVNTSQFLAPENRLTQGLVLQLSDDNNQYRVPLAFMDYHNQTINTAGQYLNKLTIFNEAGELIYRGSAFNGQNIRLIAGTYDYIAEYQEYDRLQLVVLEKQAVNSANIVNLDPALAKHRFALTQLTDEQGGLVNLTKFTGGLEAIELRHQTKSIFYNRLYPQNRTQGEMVSMQGEKALYLSDLSADYQMSFTGSWFAPVQNKNQMTVYSTVRRLSGVKSGENLQLDARSMPKQQSELPATGQLSTITISYYVDRELHPIDYPWLTGWQDAGYGVAVASAVPGETATLTWYGDAVTLTPNFGVGRYYVTYPDSEINSDDFRFTPEGGTGYLIDYASPTGAVGHVHGYRDVNMAGHQLLTSERGWQRHSQSGSADAPTIKILMLDYNIAGHRLYALDPQNKPAASSYWRCDFAAEQEVKAPSNSYEFDKKCQHLSARLSFTTQLWGEANEGMANISWTDVKQGYFSAIRGLTIGSGKKNSRELQNGNGWVQISASNTTIPAAAIYHSGQWHPLKLQQQSANKDSLPIWRAEFSVADQAQLIALKLTTSNDSGTNYSTIIQQAFVAGDPKAAKRLDQDQDGLADYKDADDDNDGISDILELSYQMDPAQSDLTGDVDKDGLTNQQEIALGTLPYQSDTDLDAMPDGWEVKNALNPLLTADGALDGDKDKLTNAAEYKAGTDPAKADSDADALPDGWEVKYTLNPLSAADAGTDPDNDELNNSAEFKAQTDPTKADTDNDGMPDGWEIKFGLNPLSASDAGSDSDNDGKTALQEYQGNTNPTVADKPATGGNTGTTTPGNSGSAGGGSLDGWWLGLLLLGFRRLLHPKA
jgi:subtilisin family serine protease